MHSMTQCGALLRTVIGCVTLFLFAGCLAPPKRHAWQISRADLSQVQGSESWPQVSTNQYVRVPDSKREDAVALLKDRPFIHLGPSQLAAFAPDVSVSSEGEAQPYLVRGVLFSSPPLFTVVRFDTAKARLLVQQFTYNGEMLMPFRWVAEPNAVVVFLSRSPEHIYSDAVLGGDWIFRGRQWNALDNR
jgi:hypothetical protein